MLIYLDIDGVMVPAASWRQPEILEDKFPSFSKMAVKSLDRLISSTGAEIVLTTSHKHKFSIKEWKSIFLSRDVHVNKISRLPENKELLNRKEELLNWFNSKIKSDDDFIIIDDDKSLNGLPIDLKKHLVQTSATVGLTEYITNEALEKIKIKKELV